MSAAAGVKPHPRAPAAMAEQDVCRRKWIQLIDFQVESRGAPMRLQVHAARELLDKIEHPVLIHCKWGADRVGLMTHSIASSGSVRPSGKARKEKAQARGLPSSQPSRVFHRSPERTPVHPSRSPHRMPEHHVPATAPRRSPPQVAEGRLLDHGARAHRLLHLHRKLVNDTLDLPDAALLLPRRTGCR